MSSQRMSRVNELMRRELGNAILRYVDDIDVSILTVTRVDTAPNLRHANVYISVRGEEDVRINAMRSLRRIRANMQDHISSVLTLKYTPKLRFVEDPSLAIGGHVLEVLEELDQESPLEDDFPFDEMPDPAEGDHDPKEGGQ